MSASQTIALTRAIERLPPVVAPEATERYLRLFKECTLGNVTCDAKDPNEALRLFQRHIVSEGPVESEKWTAVAKRIFPVINSPDRMRRLCECSKTLETAYWAIRLEREQIHEMRTRLRSLEEQFAGWACFRLEISQLLESDDSSDFRAQLPESLLECFFRINQIIAHYSKHDLLTEGMASLDNDGLKKAAVTASRRLIIKTYQFMSDAVSEINRYMDGDTLASTFTEKQRHQLEYICASANVGFAFLTTITQITQLISSKDLLFQSRRLFLFNNIQGCSQSLLVSYFAPHLSRLFLKTQAEDASSIFGTDQEIVDQYLSDRTDHRGNDVALRIIPEILQELQGAFQECRRKQRNGGTWARELITFHNMLLYPVYEHFGETTPPLFSCDAATSLSKKPVEERSAQAVEKKPKPAKKRRKQKTKRKQPAPITAAQVEKPAQAGAGAPPSPELHHEKLTWETLLELSPPPPALNKAHRVLQWETHPEAKFTHPDSRWYGYEGHTRIMQEVYHHFPDELFQLLNTPYALLGQEEHQRSFTGSDPYYLYDDVYYLYAQVCVTLSPEEMINETGVIKIITNRQTNTTYHVYMHECNQRDAWVHKRMHKRFPLGGTDWVDSPTEEAETTPPASNSAQVNIRGPNQILEMRYHIQNAPITLKLYPDFEKLLELDF